MTEEYHRSMVFSIHRFIMRLPFFPITNTIAGIFHFREKCQLSVFRRTLISLAVFSFFSRLLYVFLLFLNSVVVIGPYPGDFGIFSD